MASNAQYVTIEGRQFKDGNGDDFYPVVCNYLAGYIYKDNDTSTLCITPDISCDAWCYDCSDLTCCMDQIYSNFLRIKQMGFNTIRLFGVSPSFYDKSGELPGWKIRAMDYSYADSSDCHPSLKDEYHDYYLSQPFNTNPTVQILFTYFDSVLVRAYQADLKVIFVSGGGYGSYSLDFPADYSNYLSALAYHIQYDSPEEARETLMAYDLFNEPKNSWYWQTLWPTVTQGHSKQDVCNDVKRWHDTLKSIDPDHLITFGGCSFYDAFEYDPAVLAIDFYSPHYYPIQVEYDTNSYINMLDRVHGHHVWFTSNLPMPYLVGETGFRSEPGGTGPDGTNIEQKEYAVNTLDLTRFYDGSGYSWWNYQDYNWSAHDCFFGLLYLDTNGVVTEKPVTVAFRQYDPNEPPPTFAVPANYYDPYNHACFNPNHNHLSGNVQDQDGNPIKDAFVQGWTGIKPDPEDNTKTIYEVHYTFTDSLGDFTIIPYDNKPLLPPNNEVMVHIRVSAPGCSRYKSVWDTTGVLSNEVELIVLERQPFVYADTIRDSVCSVTSTFYAWDDLWVEDVTVQQSVGFEARARREITLDQEFHAVTGSEAWIHLEDTFFPCGEISFDDFQNRDTFMEIQNDPFNQTETLLLQFVPDSSLFDFTLFPNPGSGKVNLLVSETISRSNLQFMILDITGKPLYNGEIRNNPESIDLSGLARGVYQVMLRNQNHCKVKKLIIQ